VTIQNPRYTATMSSSDSQGLQICLWFDGNAEEAVAHYTSIFKDSKIISTARYPESGTGQETHGRVPGSVMSMEFELRGQRFSTSNLTHSSFHPPPLFFGEQNCSHI